MAMTHQGVKEWAEELEEELITFDGLDDAIVGVIRVHTQPARVAYSYEAILQILQSTGEMTPEEAIDYFDFNIGCLWAGENTPAIVYWAGDKDNGLELY